MTFLQGKNVTLPQVRLSELVDSDLTKKSVLGETDLTRKSVLGETDFSELVVFTILTHTSFVAENLSQVIGSPVQAGDSTFSSQQSLSHTRHTW